MKQERFPYDSAKSIAMSKKESLPISLLLVSQKFLHFAEFHFLLFMFKGKHQNSKVELL